MRWVPAQLPEGAEFLELPRGRVRFQVAGPVEGAPVALVHGLSYPLEVWSSLFTHLVSRGFRVCRFDLWGRGLSDFRGEALSTQALSDQLIAVLDAVGLRAASHWVSLSNADLVVTHSAAAHPERVKSLVMLAPSGLDGRTRGTALRWLGKTALVGSLWEQPLRRRFLARMESHRAHLPGTCPPESRAAYEFSIRTVKESPVFAKAALSQMVNQSTERDFRATLARLAKSPLPVTAVHFRDEYETSRDGADVFAQALPALSTQVLDGTHMGLLEAPDAVNACVETALRSAP